MDQKGWVGCLETTPVWMKWIRWLMNSACCMFWLKTKTTTNKQTDTHAQTKETTNLKLSLIPLKEEIVTLARKITKGNTLHCCPHDLPATEPLSAPSGRGGLTRLDWVDPAATTTTLMVSESLSDLEYKIPVSLAFMSFSFTVFSSFQLKLTSSIKIHASELRGSHVTVTLSLSGFRMHEEFLRSFSSLQKIKKKKQRTDNCPCFSYSLFFHFLLPAREQKDIL